MRECTRECTRECMRRGKNIVESIEESTGCRIAHTDYCTHMKTGVYNRMGIGHKKFVVHNKTGHKRVAV